MLNERIVVEGAADCSLPKPQVISFSTTHEDSGATYTLIQGSLVRADTTRNVY